jgi:hypothetical protein
MPTFRHRRTRLARKVVFFAERPVRGDVFLCVWELKKQGRNTQMKLTTVILATSMLALAPAASFAQSSPSPNNQSGPNVSPTTPSPTDPGAGADSGNTKAVPERATPGTTGAGTGTGMGRSGTMNDTGSRTSGQKQPMSNEKQ